MNTFHIYLDESDIIQFVRTVVFWENSDSIDVKYLLVHIQDCGAQLSDNDFQCAYTDFLEDYYTYKTRIIVKKWSSF